MQYIMKLDVGSNKEAENYQFWRHNCRMQNMLSTENKTKAKLQNINIKQKMQ
jgi:hypothetical protein